MMCRLIKSDLCKIYCFLLFMICNQIQYTPSFMGWCFHQCWETCGNTIMNFVHLQCCWLQNWIFNSIWFTYFISICMVCSSHRSIENQPIFPVQEHDETWELSSIQFEYFTASEDFHNPECMIGLITQLTTYSCHGNCFRWWRYSGD